MSIKGKISLSEPREIERVALRVEDLLDAALAKTTRRDGNKIKFTAGIFRIVWNSNILIPFDSGTITVHEEESTVKVAYDLSTRQLCVVGSLMILLMFTIVNYVAWQKGKFPRYELIWPMIILWLWLVGMSYILARLRFPRWLKRGLALSGLRRRLWQSRVAI